MKPNGLEKIRTDVDHHDAILRGDPATGKGGIVSLVEHLGKAVFDKDGGLIAEVQSLKKVMWMCSGAIITLQLVLKFGPLLLKLAESAGKVPAK